MIHSRAIDKRAADVVGPAWAYLEGGFDGVWYQEIPPQDRGKTPRQAAVDRLVTALGILEPDWVVVKDHCGIERR